MMTMMTMQITLVKMMLPLLMAVKRKADLSVHDVQPS